MTQCCQILYRKHNEIFSLILQGCHEFSSELYQSMRTRVASEHFYFWLNSLKEFSQAEQCLSHVEDGDYSGAMSAIAEALRSYQKGIASLTVSSLSGICLSQNINTIHPPTSPVTHAESCSVWRVLKPISQYLKLLMD